MDLNILKEEFKKYLEFKKSKNYDEKYKFDFFNNNKIDFSKSTNFVDDFKKVRSSAMNLTPQNLRNNLLIHLWEKHKNIFKNMLDDLYNENLDIKERINNFEERISKIIEEDEGWEAKWFWKLWFWSTSYLLALKNYKKYLFINPVWPFNNFMKKYNLDEKLYKKSNNWERYENWNKLANEIIIPTLQSLKKDIEMIDIQDFIFCTYWWYEKEEQNILINQNENMNLKNKISKLLDIKKQIILYWPPWTWKTYNIKNIVENHSGENYDSLKDNWRLEFITFHQSFSYEEFIEWIKPNLEWDSKNISYKIEDWIFKKIVEKSNYNYQMSSKDIKELEEKELFNNKIDDLEIGKIFSLRKWKENNFEIIEKTNDGIKISSNSSIYKDIINIKISEIEKVYFSSTEIDTNKKSANLNWYKYWRQEDSYLLVLVEEIKKQKNKVINIVNEDLKPFYLIIDEINRGNISKIFGELITLLESDKRLWEKNEITTKLPYSKEIFWIPSNLFIIATMNTSDKSIVSLDTALRRRFWFLEMLPDYSLEELKENIEWINLWILLKKLNDRIEYLLDKDHLIWHSYFTKVKSLEDLKFTIYNEIYPLLEEYFYWENEKIRLTLWINLFEKKLINKNLFEKSDIIETEEYLYEINKNLSDEDFILAIKNIIKKND